MGLGPVDAYEVPSPQGALPAHSGQAPRVYHGYSLRETGGTQAVVVEIRSGGVSGAVIATVFLAAGASRDTGVLARGVQAAGDLYVSYSGTGTPTGVVYGR